MIQRCAKTKRSGTANRLCVAKGTFLRLQLALLRWQFVRFCVGSSRFCVSNLRASVLAAREILRYVNQMGKVPKMVHFCPIQYEK
jgi:hypothetical protein